VLKEFLSAHGVQYELRDLRKDPTALVEFQRLGFRLPPVTIIDGVVVEGFQPDRLEALLLPPDEPSR